MGDDALAFHINLSTTDPKALIYPLFGHDIPGQEEETFLDFIEMNDFKKLDLDESAINLDTTSRFVYLT